MFNRRIERIHFWQLWALKNSIVFLGLPLPESLWEPRFEKIYRILEKWENSKRQLASKTEIAYWAEKSTTKSHGNKETTTTRNSLRA